VGKGPARLRATSWRGGAVGLDGEPVAQAAERSADRTVQIGIRLRVFILVLLTWVVLS
jgi:hypothetical protein